MVIIWFSGLIRGAIAFALSLKIGKDIAPHKDALISITLIIVLMTTIIMGGLMAAFAKLIGLSVESNTESHDFVARASMIEANNRKTALERKDAGWLQKKWRFIDDKYIKKIFGGDLGKNRSAVKLSDNERSIGLPTFGPLNSTDLTDKNGIDSRASRVQKFDDIMRRSNDDDEEEEEKYVARKLS
jgi:hypothetical protein